jgi:hypothetical protein
VVAAVPVIRASLRSTIGVRVIPMTRVTFDQTAAKRPLRAVFENPAV